MKRWASRVVLAGMLIAIAGAVLWQGCKRRRRTDKAHFGAARVVAPAAMRFRKEA